MSPSPFIAALTCVALLTSALCAQAQVEIELQDDLVCQTILGTRPLREERIPQGTYSTVVAASAIDVGGSSLARSNATLDFTQEGATRAARITANLLRTGPVTAATNVAPFEAIVRFTVTESFVGEFSIETVSGGFLSYSITVDAFDDGSVEVSSPGLTTPTWRQIRALTPGAIEFRVAMRAGMDPAVVSTNGLASVEILLRRYDGCGASVAQTGCHAPRNSVPLLSVVQQLDGSYLADIDNSLRDPAVANSVLLVGFRAINLPLPAGLTTGTGACILVPQPEVSIPFSRIRGFPIRLPAVPAFVQFEAFVQGVQIEQTGQLRIHEAFRIGCL